MKAYAAVVALASVVSLSGQTAPPPPPVFGIGVTLCKNWGEYVPQGVDTGLSFLNPTKVSWAQGYLSATGVHPDIAKGPLTADAVVRIVTVRCSMYPERTLASVVSDIAAGRP
jgi:hypothetical protein